jgi:predicted nucleotidyltransferase
MTKELETQVKRAAEILVAAGAREVYVFGSAATGEMHERSDLDIAVVGLPAAVFYRTGGQLLEALDIEFDLVDLDEDNAFTRHLREEGELVRVV